MKTHASTFHSPLGEILLLATDAGLSGVYFTGQRYFPKADPAWFWKDAPFAAVKRALAVYFSGKRRALALPLDLRGTDFQKRVWCALLDIAPGQTRTYGDIARGIGAPAAVRAAGAAIGRNPVSIIVPCHRVIGSGGSLTGYAGGLERKAWLLQHERPAQ
ncbi:MAG: methylated-DNA--[protein]-cysteine S-methyltransferase [Chthoniobacteraceae bacterium]